MSLTDARSARARRRKSRGQGLLEYLLILAVILSAVVVVAKPFFKKLQGQFGNSFKEGIFGNAQANLYYFPVKRR